MNHQQTHTPTNPTAHGFSTQKPSAFDAFTADPSPENAVRLAIADHRAGMTDWPFVDALHKARDICNAHASIAEQNRKLKQALEMAEHDRRTNYWRAETSQAIRKALEGGQ